MTVQFGKRAGSPYKPHVRVWGVSLGFGYVSWRWIGEVDGKRAYYVAPLRTLRRYAAQAGEQT